MSAAVPKGGGLGPCSRRVMNLAHFLLQSAKRPCILPFGLTVQDQVMGTNLPWDRARASLSVTGRSPGERQGLRRHCVTISSFSPATSP